MVDNLMDLTHETYVHTTSIGQKEIDEAPVNTKTDGDHVITSRFMNNVMPPPFWRANLRGNQLADDVPVDRWQVCHFHPPSHVMIEVGVAHAGKGGYHADAKHKVSSIVVDFLTPETETSMWYFWGMARNFNVKDTRLTAQIRDNQARVFAEDKVVLEAQQANLSRYPDRRLLMLNIDAGGVQSRRIIDRMLAAEQPQKLAA
jgi:vanillate O-demethylase monooxygenase subunit